MLRTSTTAFSASGPKWLEGSTKSPNYQRERKKGIIQNREEIKVIKPINQIAFEDKPKIGKVDRELMSD